MRGLQAKVPARFRRHHCSAAARTNTQTYWEMLHSQRNQSCTGAKALCLPDISTELTLDSSSPTHHEAFLARCSFVIVRIVVRVPRLVARETC